MALGMVDAERKRRQNVAGAEVLEIDGLVLAFSNLPDPQLNSVVVDHDPSRCARRRWKRPSASSSDGVIRSGSTCRSVATPGWTRPFGRWVSIRIIERPGMALEVDALPEAPVPHGIEIRPVMSDEDVRGLVEVGVQAFGDDPEIGMSCYGVSSRGWTAREPSSRGGARNPSASRPATCTKAPWGSWASRWFPAARTLGLGSALTVQAARAFPEGDLAWLHPSDEARSMYGRLGFRPVADHEIWIRGAVLGGAVDDARDRPADGRA